MKTFLSWPILVQRGAIDFRDLRIRRDGSLQFAPKRRRSTSLGAGRISLALGVLLTSAGVALVASMQHSASRHLPTFSTIASDAAAGVGQQLKHPNASASTPDRIQKPAERPPEQSPQKCIRHKVGASLSATDAAAVHSGSPMNFGGLIASALPSDCRASQLFLIRETKNQLVIEKLIPQTRRGLRD